MKRKLLLLVCAVLTSVGAWADVDVTASYVGDVTRIIASRGHNCDNKHKLSNAAGDYGEGYFNTQNLSGWHNFVSNTANVTNGVESWTSGAGGEGYMLGRVMVLPQGRYTLKFTAMAQSDSEELTNTVVKCGTQEQEFVGETSYDEYSFDIDVTTPNSSYQFGIYQKADGTANWAVMGAISLTLKSSDCTPIPNNSNSGWTSGVNQNTNSIEGNSDETLFLTPFNQIWIWRDNNLGDGTYNNSYTPLEDGFYRLNAWVRLYKEKEGQTTYSGATMFAGSNFVSVCSGGTLYNSNKVHLGSYSVKIDATKDVAFNYGFTLSSANFNWLSFKNITIEKIKMAEFAETLPGSAVTVGTWYKFTTGSSSDAYTLSSSGDATITYTTDGTLSDDAGVTDTWSLHAKQNVLLAPSTTYYIKSSAAVTLTKTESSVSSSFVSGWTKVTSISDLQDSPEDYFFAIFSANNTGLMLGASSSYSDTQKLCYKTAANPLSSSAYLFEVENYDGAFVLKSSNIGKYFQDTSANPWDYHANTSSLSSDCKITATLANGVYTLRTANPDPNDATANFIGLWYALSEHQGYIDGQILAGNKTNAAKSSFLIYRIAKSNLNLSAMITNPDFSASTWSNGWTGTGSNKAEAFADQSNNSNFTGHFAEMWVPNASTMSAGDIYQTLKTLPKGVYSLSATVQAGLTCKLYASTYEDEYNGSVASRSVRFVVDSPSDVKIGLKHDGTASASGDVWIAVDDFQLTYLGDVPSDSEKSIFASALSTANGYTLGFEVGDYAPYTNVAALETLVEANAIDADILTKQELSDATTTLTSATWTANTELMDAIYDGQFATATVLDATLSENSATVPGWSHSGGVEKIRQIAQLNKFTGGRAMYFWSGTVTYGNTQGYTMPLKANSVYKFSFEYAGWGEYGTNAPSVSILNESGEGKTMAALPNGATKPAVGVTSYTIYFATGATPGNYTFAFQSAYDTNTSIGNLSLKRVDALPLGANYVNGTYAAVTLNRDFTTTNWATLCVPFAFDASDFYVKELSSISVTGDHISMTLGDVTTPVAGQPYLVKAKETGAKITGTNVTLNPSATAGSTTTDEVSGYTVTYQGTYDGVTLTSSNSNAWVVKNNLLYNVNSNVNVGAYRAYFTVDGPTLVKAMSFGFDGETGITETTEKTEGTESLFDLSGRRVSKAQKGLYIMNGKKVMVK